MRQTDRLEGVVLHEVGVFDDLRLDFPPIRSSERDADKAEIHVFTGPNGCGKSTLLYALAEVFLALAGNSLVRRRFRGPASAVDFSFAGKAGSYGVRSPGAMPDSNSYINAFGTYLQTHEDQSKGEFFGYGDAG